MHQHPSALLLATALAVLAVLAGCGGGTPTGTTSHPIVRVDRSAGGVGPAGEAMYIDLSATGRYAVFTSFAGDLVAGVGPGVSHIYRKDISTGAIVLVSRAWGTAGAPAANSHSTVATISDDGQKVAFSSFASNLVAGDALGFGDVFVVDLGASSIVRVSNGIGGEANGHSIDGVDISGDGSTVVFASHASNLVTGDTNFVATGESGLDMFMYRLSGTGAGTLKRVSVDGTGAQKMGNSMLPSINLDGTVAAFQTSANLIAADNSLHHDIYRAIVDWSSPASPPQVFRMSVGHTLENPDAHCGGASISSNGRIVAYISAATNLVTGVTNGEQHIFVYDRDTLTTTCVSRGHLAGTLGNGNCSYPSLSGDGRYVAFGTAATNLVPGDTNGKWDVVVHDRSAGRTTRVSLGTATEQNDGDSYEADMSRDGSAIGFQGQGTKLPTSSPTVFHVYRVLNTPSGSG